VTNAIPSAADEAANALLQQIAKRRRFACQMGNGRPSATPNKNTNTVVVELVCLDDGELREHQRVALPNPASRLISSFDPSMVKSAAASACRKRHGPDEKKLTFEATSRP
jgi:hypothetical protein